ncbi:MAG: diguanylate cyclase [Myxococcota bacterium]
MADLPDTVEVVAWHRAPEGEQAARVPMLIVVQGSEADLGAHARVEQQVVIGRDGQAELTLTDAGTSKRHAVVEKVKSWRGRVSYRVKDLGSTNGTHLNGRRIGRHATLADGDKITVGGTTLRFSLADEVDAAFQAQVDAMLSTDDLTGLIVRRRFEAALEEALRAARAQSTRLALLVLDIDGLKAINDTHGHSVGAFTIGQVGRLLAGVVQPRGVATRFGGDEFVAFLPLHDRPAALEVAEELRRVVAEHAFVHGAITVHPTLSIGVAVFPDAATTTQALFDAADRALYRAKALGKNRVT